MKINRSRLRYLFAMITTGLFLNTFIFEAAMAIPAFARDTKMTCSSCHNAWPALNAFGHKYKENGYRFAPLVEGKEKLSDDLSWSDKIPISTVIIGRPYDKKDSGNTKTRAIHEVELMVAGPMSKELSGFFEIEAEDEDTNARGFETGIPTAALTYTVNKGVNVQLSWADLLWFDPYNTYTSGHRMTRGYNALIDQSFGGADNNKGLRTSRQNITVYGRPINDLFYGVSFSGVADNAEGEEADTTTARIAYQITQSIMVGGLYIDGSCSAKIGLANCAVNRNYTRQAVDFEFNSKNILVNSAYMKATDDNSTATAEVKNDAAFVQGMYTFRGKGGRATWAPLARVDQYEKVNGTEDITELTLGINYYVSENIRAMLEFWDRSGDGATIDDDRTTLQVYASF